MTDEAVQPATRLVARFVSGVNVGSRAPALAETARRHIADTMACILAGATSDAARIVADGAAGLSGIRGPGAYPVPGVGWSSDPAWAAFVAGVAAHVEDFDDTSRSMRGHPSAPVLSTLIPQTYGLDLSGHRFLLAYTVGVEVAAKLGRFVGGAHTLRGWHTISTLGALGAVCACASAQGLAEEETARAIGIGASFAGGLVANFGTMVKSLHCGKAAWTGVVAADLARKGFEASAGILEAKDGFLQVFGEPTGGDIEALTGLGAPWDLVDPGIDIKIYPSCNCTHPAVDAAIDLSRDHRVAPERIRRIRCWVSTRCGKYLVCPAPTTPLQAKFSMPYCVATALIHGRLGRTAFTMEALQDARVAALMPKVSLQIWAGDRPPEGPDVEIELEDGTTRCVGVLAPRGTPGNPATWADIEAKFLDCGQGVVPAPALRDALALIRHLDELPSVRPLLDRLTPATAGVQIGPRS